MIVLEQGGFTPMSGGNTIAARATIEDARVVAVTVVNVPAFVVALEGPAPG